MPGYEVVSIDDEIHSYITDNDLLRDSIDFRTQPHGSYTLIGQKAETRLNAEDHEYDPGWYFVNTVWKTLSEHVLFQDVSWEPTVRAGTKDRRVQLWGQLVMALEMTGRPNGEIVNAIPGARVGAEVTETAKVRICDLPEKDAKWRLDRGADLEDMVYYQVRDPDTRIKLASMGYTYRNYIQRFFRSV